ncbi:MAG: HEPN domain-containing protein [Verrucomicrobia bacterium]|nr:HEPN domain-containing protein [Verrucomicrobiota bacterium]
MKGDPGQPANWHQLARRDLDKARRDLEQDDLPYAAMQLQQAAEKACKGWLLAHGWKLIKTHDLVFLLDEIKARSLDLDWFAPSAALLSKEFFEERYVSWDAEPTPSAVELRQVHTEVERLFAALNVP